MRQRNQSDDQVATHGAADAVVVHFGNLFAAILHQDFLVDILLAELVFTYGNLVAVLLLQDAVERSSFIGAEKASTIEKTGITAALPAKIPWRSVYIGNTRAAPALNRVANT